MKRGIVSLRGGGREEEGSEGSEDPGEGRTRRPRARRRRGRAQAVYSCVSNNLASARPLQQHHRPRQIVRALDAEPARRLVRAASMRLAAASARPSVAAAPSLGPNEEDLSACVQSARFVARRAFRDASRRDGRRRAERGSCTSEDSRRLGRRGRVRARGSRAAPRWPPRRADLVPQVSTADDDGGGSRGKARRGQAPRAGRRTPRSAAAPPRRSTSRDPRRPRALLTGARAAASRRPRGRRGVGKRAPEILFGYAPSGSSVASLSLSRRGTTSARAIDRTPRGSFVGPVRRARSARRSGGTRPGPEDGETRRRGHRPWRAR